MSRSRAEVRISGRVQGVNFRHFVMESARRQGVSGWVRNLADGDVAAVFEGEKDAVENLVQACRQGPPAARVADVAVDWQDDRGEFSAFSVRY